MSTEYMRDKLHKNQMIMPWGKSETISTVDAAAMMQCDKKTVTKMIDEGKIDAYQLRPGVAGSPWRVFRFSVERYIERLKKHYGLDSGESVDTRGTVPTKKATRK